MKKGTIDKTPEPLEKAADECPADEKAPPGAKVGQPDGHVKAKVIQITDARRKRLA